VGLSVTGPVRKRRLPSGVWRGLLAHALRLVDEIERHGTRDPIWTLGGGTALMLRYEHRYSKDIDIFVPDPQYLGFVTPRLSEVAQSISDEHVEGAGYVKLILPEGEIDFVAARNLTEPAYETWRLLRRPVRVELPAPVRLMMTLASVRPKNLPV
jgi:Nucleotidyl transferase AbiEii toxin, Type IV TA system